MALNVTGYLGRNGLRGWAVLNPRVALAEKRLMDAWVKEHPACEACGESRRSHVDCHHRTSLWHDTSQAGTNPAGRFCVLCNDRASAHHLHLGHSGSFALRYVENLSMVCAATRAVLAERKAVHRENTVDQRAD